MLFRQRTLEGIQAGTITLAFRRWQRPAVRAGGTQLTAVGQLEFGSVMQVSEAEVSEEDARKAGFESLADLLEDLSERKEGLLYRVELRGLRPDPRISLRETLPLSDERDQVTRKLDDLDSRADDGAWTWRVLDIIARNPGVRAGTICRQAGMEKQDFKLRVRKLKKLGLTESLEVGYRLSPRGAAIRALVHE
jgi:hypothetical protein